MDKIQMNNHLIKQEDYYCLNFRDYVKIVDIEKFLECDIYDRISEILKNIFGNSFNTWRYEFEGCELDGNMIEHPFEYWYDEFEVFEEIVVFVYMKSEYNDEEIVKFDLPAKWLWSENYKNEYDADTKKYIAGGRKEAARMKEIISSKLTDYELRWINFKDGEENNER